MMTRLFAAPVMVSVGGRPLAVPPLRIRDLAALEAFSGWVVPPPPTEPPDGLDDWARARWLAARYREAKQWPPAWDSAALAGLLETAAGFAALLLVLLGPGRGGTLTEEEALDLSARATGAERSAVRVAALGLTPADVLARLLDPRSLAGDPVAERVTLAEAIDALAAERGWTYEQIGDLTLAQFRMARAGGKLGKVKLIPRPGQSLLQAAQWRKRLFLDPDPGPPDGWTPDDF